MCSIFIVIILKAELADRYCAAGSLAGLLIWGTLSEERTGLSFTFAVGLRQRGHIYRL
jgi:hypothetical protein